MKPTKSSTPKSESNSATQHINMGMDLINVLPVAVYTCDPKGRITSFNEAAAALWGRRPEIGKDLWCGSWKIYQPDGEPLDLDTCPMAITLREGRPIRDVEIIVERPDGMRINVLPHPQPIYDSEGHLIGAINMLVDISDRTAKERIIKLNEERYKQLSETLEKKVQARTLKLKKSEERYFKMIEEVEDYAILLLDTEGHILNWNRGAEKIKGYKEEEILGKHFRVFYGTKDRENKLPESLIEQAKKFGKAMHEGWRVRKDGTKFWGYIVITTLHDDKNNIIGFSKVTRDLTERKIAEDQLNAYARSIEQQNQQLEEFAFIASHDLQEPLRKIQTFADMVDRNIEDRDAVKNNITKITTSARKMATLIRDVLKYSQLTNNESLIGDVDLNQVIENVKSDLDLLIEERNVTITTKNLPVIKGIAVQLHQLFFNLVSNSIKFNVNKPLIEISAESATNSEIKKISQLDSTVKHLKIIFRDNGIGFKQQYAEQVFKLFQRLDSEHKGTGIGLALCKRIIENHHGQIKVVSTPEEGTEFTIYLPVSAPI